MYIKKLGHVIFIFTIIQVSATALGSSPLQCPPIDKNGQKRTDSSALEMLNQCIDREISTYSRYYNPKTKSYPKKRQRLHNKIASYFTHNKKCVRNKQPFAIFTAGLPGAGKTSFIKKHYQSMINNDTVFNNLDDISARFPEYKGWNIDSIYEEARSVQLQLLKKSTTPCKHNVIFDSTLSHYGISRNTIDFFKDLDYKIFIVYVDIPRELSVQKARKRYQKKGRPVPKETIYRISKTTPRNFKNLKSLANGYIIVDGVTKKIVKQHGESLAILGF